MPLTNDQIAWLQRNKAMSGASGTTLATAPPAGATGGPTAPTSAPGGPAEQAEARITTTFGARFAPPGQPAGDASAPKAWNQDEVDSVDRAFKAIPAADNDVLRNINLSRVTSLPSGRDTLAEFQDAADSRSGTVTRTILVADGNFSANRGQTLSNDEPARGIVHEVGHAIAHKARDDAELADVKAIRAIVDAEAERDQAVAAHEDLKKSWTGPDPADQLAEVSRWPNSAAKRKRLKELNDEIDRREKAEAPLVAARKAAWAKVDAAYDARKQTERALADTKVPKEIVDAGQARLDSSAAQAGGEAPRVASDISKMSPGQLQASKDYRTTSSSVTGMLQAYSDAIKAGKVGPRDDQKSPNDWDSDLAFVFSGRDNNRKALESSARDNPALTILAPLDRAQDSWRKEAQTQARLPERVPKVQEFVVLVSQAPTIEPGTISNYAAANWPDKPEEFFAECYSIWRMNRGRLPKRILDWFDRGSYR